jgi:Ca2+-binding EF-hand superfamily protein
MLDSFGTCLAPLHRRAETFLKRLTAMHKMSGFKGRKPYRLSSKFDFSTTSFASMEVSNQFKEVFKVIDANGDGKISTFELSELLLCLGYQKSTAFKEAQGMVSAMDYDGDGLIDLDEFIDAMNTSRKFGVEKEEDHLMDAFVIFDADRNGLISPRELQRVLTNLGCDGCSLEECRRMIKAVDKDGDGFVGFEDFRSMMSDN